MNKYWPYRVSCVLLLLYNLTFIDKAIDISGSRLYEQGGTTNITCSTPVRVQSIQWVDQSNTVVRGGMAVQELLLNIMSLNSNYDSTTYRCVINDSMYTESRNITINVGCKLKHCQHGYTEIPHSNHFANDSFKVFQELLHLTHIATCFYSCSSLATTTLW